MSIAAIAIGDGIGNQVMTTPMIQAVKELGYDIDLYQINGIHTDMFDDWKILNKIVRKRQPDKPYDVVIKTWSVAGFTVPETKQYIVTSCNLDKMHEAEGNFQAARQLGYKRQMPDYYVGVADRDFQLPPKTVGIHPGCHKNWDLKVYPHFPKLVDLLVEHKYNVVLVGGPHDLKIDKWNPNVIDYINKLSIRETAAVIAQSDFFISGDSGLMHMACAVRTEGIAIFGPTSLKKNRPFCGKIKVVRKELENCVVPCYETRHGVIRRWSKCKYDKECLRSIMPEEILEKVKETL